MMSLTDIFSSSANPLEAQHDFESFQIAYQEYQGSPLSIESPGLPLLGHIFGNSRFLSRWVIRHPHLIQDFLDSPDISIPRHQKDLEKELQNFIQKYPDSFSKALRLFKYKEYLRITLRDLLHYSTEEILAEISLLAEIILKRAHQYILTESLKKINPQEVPCKCTILGMGKLGGMELNYSSDIDLIALYERDETKGDLSSHEFHSRHFQKLSQLLTESSAEGFLYRVDWDLRPEGKAGTLVNSLQAMLTYYETFGGEWERQAYTKARVLAGDTKLGDDFLKSMEPFIYRRSLDPSHIDSMRSMKDKIREELEKKKHEGFHVKLGKGGIREIEFFIQAFLMIYGGKNPELRHYNTLTVLESLQKNHLINPTDALFLKQAYLFLRRVENSLQMVDEAQTHLLNSDPKERLKTARRLGYQGENDDSILHSFGRELEKITSGVHSLFEALFSEKKPLSIISEKMGKLFLNEESNPDALPARLKALLDQDTHFELNLDTLRFFKKEEIRRIEVLEKKPLTHRPTILLRLSHLAESIAQEALFLSEKIVLEKYGKPRYSKTFHTQDDSQFIVLAMGKLGGYEINYGSDLDVIFLYSENGETTGPTKITNGEYFAKLAQKFISILSVPTRYGVAYSVDTELRPAGHSGPLVTNMESFLDYQKNVSQVWERQALLRARPLAGSKPLARLIQSYIQSILFSHGASPSIREEMHFLRKRVETELAKENNHYFDFKLGAGGLMDIEFIVQYIQLTEGYRLKELQTPNLFELLEFLCKTSFIKLDFLLLREAYFFYRTFESRITLNLKRSSHRLLKTDPVFENVARDLYFNSPEKLLEQYNLYRERVRREYEKVF